MVISEERRGLRMMACEMPISHTLGTRTIQPQSGLPHFATLLKEIETLQVRGIIQGGQQGRDLVVIMVSAIARWLVDTEWERREEGGGRREGGEGGMFDIINSHMCHSHCVNDDGDESGAWNTRMGLGRLRCSYLPYRGRTGGRCCTHTHRTTHRTGPQSTWACS